MHIMHGTEFGILIKTRLPFFTSIIYIFIYSFIKFFNGLANMSENTSTGFTYTVVH